VRNYIDWAARHARNEKTENKHTMKESRPPERIIRIKEGQDGFSSTWPCRPS